METIVLDTHNLLVLGIAAFLLIVLFKVAKALFKMAAFLVAAGLLFYFWQGGTVENLEEKGLEKLISDSTLKEMKAMCRDDKEAHKCICIINPVVEDLEGRLSKKELRKLEKDEELRKQEIKKSFLNQKLKITACLVEHKGEKLKEGFEKVVKVIDKELNK